ncbi:MAG: hypothetical protein AAGF58_08820, partial [Pseudomonadota bacterium]
MRIRSARTLVFSREGDELIACNYLANSTFACSPDLLTFLTRFDDWATMDEVAEFVPLMAEEEIAETVEGLIGVHAITPEGSSWAKVEDAYSRHWKWGIPAALFHFSVQDREYMSLDQMEDMQRVKLAADPQPN